MLKKIKQTALRAFKMSRGFSLVESSRWRCERLLILAYHGVSIEDEHLWDPSQYFSLDEFHTRFQLIKDGGYNVLPLDEALQRLWTDNLPPKSIALTFDDGHYCFYKRIFPLIREFGFPATVYIATFYAQYQRPIFDGASSYILWKGRDSVLDGRAIIAQDIKFDLGTLNSRRQAWSCIRDFAGRNKLSAEEKDALLARLAKHLRVDFEEMLAKRVLHVMKPAEVSEIAEAGIDVQLHTHRHRTPDQRALFIREIQDNRRAIMEYTGKTAAHFCYPSGVHCTSFFPWLKECGVISATTTETGLASRSSGPFTLPRLIDTSFLSPIEFEGWLTGVAHCLPNRPALEAISKTSRAGVSRRRAERRNWSLHASK